MVISLSDYKYYTKDGELITYYSSNMQKSFKTDYDKYKMEYDVCEATILSIDKDFFNKAEVS